LESIKRCLRYYKPCFDSGRAYAVKDNYFLIRPRVPLRFVVGRIFISCLLLILAQP